MAEHRIIGNPPEADPLAAFKAADGLLLWSGGAPVVLRGGQYGNGAGALYLDDGTGASIGKVTVNIVDPVIFDERAEDSLSLMPGRFFVNVYAGFDEKLRLLDLGICRRVGEKKVAQGFVDDYAEVWAWTRCDCGLFTIQCECCRAALKADFDAHVQRALAKDSVRRLKGAKI